MNEIFVKGNASTSDISYFEGEADLIDEFIQKHDQFSMLQSILGCIYGQALGDAYGLATEFETRCSIDKLYPDGREIPFPNFITTHHSRRWMKGDWTDDTDQWILIMETIIEQEGVVDVKVFAKKLLHWIHHGFPQLKDFGGLGLGQNVSMVCSHRDFLEDPHKASKDIWERNNRNIAPNGAIMRCSILGLYQYEQINQVIANTVNIAKVTHFDPRCQASCLVVNLCIAYLLQNPKGDIEDIVRKAEHETINCLGDSLSKEQKTEFLWYTNIDRTLDDLKLDESSSIGYTYKCMASGFHGLRSEESFEQTLHKLIREGGDADTNGAVCGSLYGTKHGYKALPKPWLQALPYKKWLDQKVMQFLPLINLQPSSSSEMITEKL
ncbi:unnamed protein product [Didymodactylos carnosus]|uniref:ADP-ribosylglycohydrolase n=1 Tax=Didymodactylos carnosus TaxID=1234261 RepID=A0A814R7R1_9BILA|nr:unnamed protein product [Didymodactylos carnosus]CAF1130204.1 unnamed protein product [Didymodactylos carnosus]CAF3665287.1 unnamed protein product [Didymodactylos carnosus]CAF3893912.1 unnamed protein product [Didymodactylos carnosus]